MVMENRNVSTVVETVSVLNSATRTVLALVIIGFLDAKARHEERRLHLKFPDYESYSRRVKRLLPWIY